MYLGVNCLVCTFCWTIWLHCFFLTVAVYFYRCIFLLVEHLLFVCTCRAFLCLFTICTNTHTHTRTHAHAHTHTHKIFDVRGSGHHSIIYKENPTRCNSVSKFYFIFMWSSACFGRHTAHHQEPKTALGAFGIAYVKGCWTCSCWTLPGLPDKSPAITRPTTTRQTTLHVCKTRGC
jgi:hypothetical protein